MFKRDYETKDKSHRLQHGQERFLWREEKGNERTKLTATQGRTELGVAKSGVKLERLDN